MTNGTVFDDIMNATSKKNEKLFGLGGDDTFHFFLGDNTDRFIGGSGNDVLYVGDLLIDEASSLKPVGGVFKGGSGFDALVFQIDLAIPNPTFRSAALGLKTISVETRVFDINVQTSFGDTWTTKIRGGKLDEVFGIFDANGGGRISLDARLGGGDDTIILYGINTDFATIDIRTGGGRDTIVMERSVDGAVLATGNGKDVVVLDSLNQELVKTGKGSDAILVGTEGYGQTTDQILTGGGRDKIVLNIDSAFNFEPRAIIGDFTSGKDKIIIADDGMLDRFDGDRVFFSEQEAANNSSYSDNWIYDAAEGTLSYDGDVILEFATPLDLVSSDFKIRDSDFFDDFL